jgi:predicted nucleic acid-binding protein
MPERRWVINASPLILLGKIGRLDLLRPLTTVLRIPRGVKREVECGDPADPAHCWIASVPEDWLADCPFMDLTVAAWNLGRGETEVLSYARANPGFTAVIDDLQARECALSLGLPIQGTLGVLLRAKEHGLMQELRPALEDLQANDMRLSAKLIDKVLQLTGEEG